MGCFYTGFDYKNRKNGYFKIGETSGKTPAARLSQIRTGDSFQCLGYLILHNESKPERLFVESYVRMMMSKKYEHTQNDHFLYRIESKERKYPQAFEMANEALEYAKTACSLANIDYDIGTKTYKRS
jgi:hypothetical protein